MYAHQILNCKKVKCCKDFDTNYTKEKKNIISKEVIRSMYKYFFIYFIYICSKNY